METRFHSVNEMRKVSYHKINAALGRLFVVAQETGHEVFRVAHKQRAMNVVVFSCAYDCEVAKCTIGKKAMDVVSIGNGPKGARWHTS